MKGQLITAILCCAMANASHAQEGFAICNFGKQRVPTVICYGPAMLKDTVVTGTIKVVGPLTASKILANTITVTGSVDLSNAEVSGQIEVTGNLSAQDSHLYKGLSIDSGNAVLSDTVVTGDIRMNSAAAKQVVTLQCKTSVAGNIIFGGVAGVVQVSGDSTLQGKVQNGATEFINVNCS